MRQDRALVRKLEKKNFKYQGEILELEKKKSRKENLLKMVIQ